MPRIPLNAVLGQLGCHLGDDGHIELACDDHADDTLSCEGAAAVDFTSQPVGPISTPHRIPTIRTPHRTPRPSRSRLRDLDRGGPTGRRRSGGRGLRVIHGW